MTVLKTCTRCNQPKKLEAFCKKGLGLAPACRECMKEIQHSHYRDNSAYYKTKAKQKEKELSEYIRNLKDNQPCTDCKVKYPYYVLDFDHITAGSKQYNISRLAKYGSKAKIDAEVAKCEIVCSNCHRERTQIRKQRAIV